MYNAYRGPPSRIINRTRRDISQKIESFDQNRKNQDPDEGGEETHHHNNLQEQHHPHHQPQQQQHHHHHHHHHQQEVTMTSPRPIFQTVNNKGCRSTNGRGPAHEVISPQHEELIRFFNESWGRVLKEVEMSRQSGHDSRGNSGISYYQDKHVHPALEDFKPFDLEAWWGRRIYQNLTQST